MAVFISYVREDARVADHIARVLRENGLQVFFDRDDIRPGTRWKDAIRSGISSGSYFLALFSKNHNDRTKSYANEELLQAIEMLRQMPRERTWLIPMKIDDCRIPDLPIGPGESLHDLNWISLLEHGYLNSLRNLLEALGISDPRVNFGEPVAFGYSHFLELRSGTIIYDEVDLSELATIAAPTVLNGTIFFVTGGWCARQPEGFIAARILVNAPNDGLQQVNHLLGLDTLFAISERPHISLDYASPTPFFAEKEFIIPRGTEMPSIFGFPSHTLSEDLPFVAKYVANGYIKDDCFSGHWSGSSTFTVLPSPLEIRMSGRFQINVE